jgi:hypothetical protein
MKNVFLQFIECSSFPLWPIPAGGKRSNMEEDWNLAEINLLYLDAQCTEKQNHFEATHEEKAQSDGAPSCMKCSLT